MNVFEWDRSKPKQNEAKHGISLADTFGVFEDANALTLDQHVGGEERFVSPSAWTASGACSWWCT